MDFSKIRKIFYIVAIISMLLSIKSKVFGAIFNYEFDNTNYTLLLPDFIDEHNLNYFVDFYYGSNGVGFDLIITENTELNVTSNYQHYYYFNNQQFVYYTYSTSLSNFNAQGMNTFLNNATNYFKSLTYSNNYENKQGYFGTGGYYGLYRNDYQEVQSYLSTININQNNNTIFPSNSFDPPFFTNLTEIKNGYPDGVFISRGDYSDDVPLYFHLLKITNTVPDGNQSTYYYEPKVFKLTKDSKYYRTYDADTDNKYSYYYIKRSELTLDTDSSYLYVLSNSGNSITNSYGILQPDIPRWYL